MSRETEQWLPLYARNAAGEEEFFKLYEGVPSWLRESLWEWLSKRLSRQVNLSNGSYWDPHAQSIRELERLIRQPINWTGGGREYSDRIKGLAALRTTLYADSMAFMTAVDYRLSKLDPDRDKAKIDELETVLSESSSKWRVSTIFGRPGLTERIDETVQAAAEALAAREGRPGSLLADAWRHAFSMNRDPSAAYRCAVRAVEAAAGPILTPKDPVPSLGKMIPALRDKPEKWHFSFSVDSAVNPKDVLRQMMQLLWTNEYSRHVDQDITSPLHVSQDEAESAVVLALTLTTFFTSGSVRPA